MRISFFCSTNSMEWKIFCDCHLKMKNLLAPTQVRDTHCNSQQKYFPGKSNGTGE